MKILALVLLLTGCSTVSVTQLTPAEPIPFKQCQVQIVTTKPVEPITELCIVSAKPPMGWDHSVGSSIENAKKGLCKCGAVKAYLKDQREQGFFDPAMALLVGYK